MPVREMPCTLCGSRDHIREDCTSPMTRFLGTGPLSPTSNRKSGKSPAPNASKSGDSSSEKKSDAAPSSLMFAGAPLPGTDSWLRTTGKRCKKCKQLKVFSAFPEHRNECRDCRRTYLYNRRHPDTPLAYGEPIPEYVPKATHGIGFRPFKEDLQRLKDREKAAEIVAKAHAEVREALESERTQDVALIWAMKRF